jgi:hypothetical protein
MTQFPNQVDNANRSANKPTLPLSDQLVHRRGVITGLVYRVDRDKASAESCWSSPAFNRDAISSHCFGR